MIIQVIGGFSKNSNRSENTLSGLYSEEGGKDSNGWNLCQKRNTENLPPRNRAIIIFTNLTTNNTRNKNHPDFLQIRKVCLKSRVITRTHTRAITRITTEQFMNSEIKQDLLSLFSPLSHSYNCLPRSGIRVTHLRLSCNQISGGLRTISIGLKTKYGKM